MTIWILALVLLASGAGLGLRQGAIRTASAFVSILIALLFAGLIGKIFKWLLPHLGWHDPVTLWAVPPILGFILVWLLLKGVSFEIHRRTDVYYRYKVNDLQRALWERLNMRVGGCVGLLNGTAWLVLISFLIFNYSYLTAQVAPSENQPFITRFINRMGHDLQDTGLDKVGRAFGSVPDTYYRTANLGGLLAQNPSLSERLGNYPAFISLTERDDIKQLMQDSSLAQGWKSGTPLNAALSDSQVQGMIKDTNLLAIVWNNVQENMDDLTNYLVTGKSLKYDSEKIVGHWSFDLVPALAAFREANPKIRPNDMKAIRALWSKGFAQTTFVAGTDGQAFLKDVPNFKTQPPGDDTWKGQWDAVDNTNSELSLSSNGRTSSASAQTDGLRLTIKMGPDVYVFERID